MRFAVAPASDCAERRIVAQNRETDLARAIHLGSDEAPISLADSVKK